MQVDIMEDIGRRRRVSKAEVVHSDSLSERGHLYNLKNK